MKIGLLDWILVENVGMLNLKPKRTSWHTIGTVGKMSHVIKKVAQRLLCTTFNIVLERKNRN